MKKKNLSSLILRKSKISNLHNLAASIGGTDTGAGSDAGLESLNGACGVSAQTNCHSCAPCETITSVSPTDCITNDKTRSLRPTAGIECNGLFTGEVC